jgi:polysaccharide biosynthesis protein PslG
MMQLPYESNTSLRAPVLTVFLMVFILGALWLYVAGHLDSYLSQSEQSTRVSSEESAEYQDQSLDTQNIVYAANQTASSSASTTAATTDEKALLSAAIVPEMVGEREVESTTTTQDSVDSHEVKTFLPEPEAIASRRISQTRKTRTISNPTTVVVATTSNLTQTPVSSASPLPSTVKREVGLSVADDLTGLSQTALDQWFVDMKSLGVTWVRLDFDWSWIQSDKNAAIDWTKIDRVVASAQKYQLHLLPILVYTPTWARPAGCDSNRCPPANNADYANFAKLAVARYAPLGVHAWEIWNEPNMKGSWLPASNPSQYTQLLMATYGSIKSIDPSATVVTGGVGPIETANGNIQALEFVQAMYAAGAKPYFDALGFHPYSFPALPSYQQDWNAWQQAANTKISMRSIMTTYGDSSKKIWITEYGAPTGGPGTVADIGWVETMPKTTHVTEAYQSSMLVDAIQYLDSSTWDGPLFWYSYKDYNSTVATTIENHFGILHSDGTKKPSYFSLLQLLQ